MPRWMQKSFGYSFNESQLKAIKVLGKGITNLAFEINTTKNYSMSKNTPYLLERDLGFCKDITNQIGQIECRPMKRYIDLSAIFGKDTNNYRYETSEKQLLTCINFVKDSCINIPNIIANITERIPLNTSYAFIPKKNGWIIEFYNMFDLDPSFIDDTDTNWNTNI